MSHQYLPEARAEWNKARRKVMWSNIVSFLQRDNSELMNFNEVAQRLNLKHAVYRGVQVVPLERIVGSVGRYQDFTDSFLPRSAEMGERWANVATLQLDGRSQGFPPVEIYKIGKWYFVKDGHHRISVARQLDLPDIEAYVWEYAQPELDVRDSSNLDEVLLGWEYQDFINQTKLDELRPDHDFQVTVPGGYHQALTQISHYQSVLSKIDKEPIAYQDAVTAWYDMVFETLVHQLRESGIFDLFPNRTSADFFVWITRYREKLEDEYGEKLFIQDVVHEVKKQHAGFWGWLKRLWQKAEGIE